MSEDIKKAAGRPRKVFDMEETAPVITEETVEVKPAAMLNTAFGLAQNSQGRWCVCVISFDINTRQAVVKEVSEESSKLGAAMRFRVLAGPHLV